MSKLASSVLLFVAVFGATSELRAESAKAKAAAVAYQKAVMRARNTYIRALDAAIKEEGSKGNLKEATQLKDKKTSLELQNQRGSSNPAFLATRQLENSRWGNARNPKGFLQFLENNQTQNHLKTGGAWIATDKSTVITQSRNSGHIYLFQFSDDFKTATVHRFVNAKTPTQYIRQ